MSKVSINESSLVAIGDAIRAKNGSSDKYSPAEMVVAIGAIETGGGGGLTEEDLTFTGNIGYMFSNGNFMSWQDKFPFILKDIERAEKLFFNMPQVYDLSKITITTKDYTDVNDGAYVYYMFDSSKASTLPTVNGRIALLNQNLFNGCRYLTDDIVRNFIMNPNLEFAWCNSAARSSNPGLANMFYYCTSLRNISDILLYIHQYFRDNQPVSNSGVSDYYTSAFYNCEAMDEICNIPVFNFSKENPTTSNAFSSFCSYTGRLKNIMFATDNGTPYKKKWKSQTLELHNRVGYIASYQSNLSGYNNGITADKEVKDDATYQALKNDPDWFTTDVAYSRYNHDSAVNTINSLPDTSEYLASAGGTNTIKFKGAAGSKTDGGAINTLTEAEIAVAAAKGWTVTFA